MSSKILRKQLIEEQDGKCNICKENLIGELCTLDHIIPKAIGGENNYNNLQLLCISCNLEKTAKDLKDIWNLRKKVHVKQKHSENRTNGK